MCGIAALFALRSPTDLRSIREMTALIRHRGPDDEGYVFFPAAQAEPKILGGNDTPQTVLHASHSYCPRAIHDPTFNGVALAALGHRRLSILDLSPAGHQPLSLSDQSLWITYNGEVYNYLEIRKELETLGHHFDTHSDTEVILKAYIQWGKACVERFNGMFAFVIYDWRRRRAFVARDRFGVKPLYYWESPQGVLAFASEIKAFTAIPGWQAVLEHQSAYDYLNWGVTDHAGKTLFKGVQQLRGGHLIEFSLDAPRISPTRWYELKARPFEGSLDKAAASFADLLQDAIRLRLRADVDVGSCLSGGLDSSSIVCIANRELRSQGASYRQKTFSACSEVARFDERRFIDLVVHHTDVEGHYVYPSRDRLFEELDTLIWHQDEPFGSTSMYAQWLVFALAGKERIKVMLDGQGADEQLGGYHGFMGNRLYDLFKSFQWGQLVKEAASVKQLHRTQLPIQQFIAKLLPQPLLQPLKKLMGKSSVCPEWLNLELLAARDRHPFQGLPEKSVYAQSRLQLLHSSLPMLLRYEDRNSMAHSVESRTPFLDYRLVEFNLGLPSQYKLWEGWTKYVLRAGMKGILPEPIRLRVDKIGFATAEEVWVRQECADRFRYCTKEALESSLGVLKPQVIDILEEIIAGKRSFSFLPFRFICFGKWMQRFQVNLR